MTKITLYSAYESDPILEKAGVWIVLAKDLEIKLASFGNDAHMEYLEKLQKPYKAQIRRDALPKHIDEDIHCRAMAKEVILDWRGEGWVDRDGKPLAYSVENAYTLLSDPKMKKLKADIIYLATNNETFRQMEEDKADAIKN